MNENKRGKIIVSGTEYEPGEGGTIYAQIFNPDGTPAKSATVTLTLYKSDETKILDTVSMDYITDSNGVYKYNFVSPLLEGTYIADVSSTNPEAWGSDEIHVSITPQVRSSKGQQEQSNL